MALEVSDRGYVFELGSIVATASAKELLLDERLTAAYLGG